MPSARNRAETPESTGERKSLAMRLLALPMRALAAARAKPLLFCVLLSGIAVIVGSGASVIYHVVTHLPNSDRQVTTAAALQLLDAGEYEKAGQMAVRLGRKVKGDYGRMGHPLFVLGAALAHEADRSGNASERETNYLVAARYLEESQSRGFPPGREKEGVYLLATCLFNAGSYAESLPVLHEALEELPGQKYALSRLLSQAYTRDAVPNRKQALNYTRIWLENPALTAVDRDKALLQLAEISLGQRDKDACREALSQIRQDSPAHGQALALEARMQIQEGDDLITALGESGSAVGDAKEKYRAAISNLERALSKDTVGTTTRQARYLIGICYRKFGDLRAAAKAFETTRHLHYRTPESLAATLAEAEINQQLGQGDKALELYRKVLEEAGPALAYQNRWIPLDQLRGRLDVALQQFAATQEYDTALALADACGDILPEDEIVAAKAETHEAWAEKLLQEADEMGIVAGRKARADARRHFRLAGDLYHKLAGLRYATSEHPAYLWKSGNCFLRGKNFELALRILREHLNNVPRKQAAQGLVGMGECHLALGHHNTAISILNECIKFFPKHPESYRARVLSSDAYRENSANAKDEVEAQKMLDTAKALLIDNLHNSSLTPRSKRWQQSLLAYGTLLYREALIRETKSLRLMRTATADDTKTGLQELKQSHNLFQEAISSLKETVSREEKLANEEGREPNSAEARYYIAEAYRHSAHLPRKSLEIEPTQTRRNSLRQKMRAYLQESAEAHGQLQEHLARKQTETELSVVEQRLLRNTYFARADALFSIGEYDQAIGAYVEATNRYQHEPEALEALMQIASCYRKLKSPIEARGTLVQARSVLDRIRADANFTATTRYNQKQWEQLIDWLSTL